MTRFLKFCSNGTHVSTFTAAKKDQTSTNKTTYEATPCNSGVGTLPATLLKKMHNCIS